MRNTERQFVIGFAYLLMLWALLSNAYALQQSAWRPFANHAVLVTLGMSKGEVLLKAGEPSLVDVMSHEIHHLRTITVWTYIRPGHNAAIATLTFSSNTLTKIEIKIVHP